MQHGKSHLDKRDQSERISTEFNDARHALTHDSSCDNRLDLIQLSSQPVSFSCLWADVFRWALSGRLACRDVHSMQLFGLPLREAS